MTPRKFPYLFLFLVIGAMMLLAGCSHGKKTAKTKQNDKDTTGTVTQTPATTPTTLTPKVQAALNGIRANEVPFAELQGKMKTKATWDGRTQSFVTQLRWKKGDRMWMSMSIIGIEGARALITKDSVKVIDRINQRNILRPISYVEQKTHVALSFSDIEKIFLPQLFLVDTTRMELTETADQLILKSNGTRFVSAITMDKAYRIKNMLITDVQHKQTIQADYSNYQTVGQKPFPMDRYLKIVSGSYIFELDAKFQSVDITKKLSYPFETNPGYKVE